MTELELKFHLDPDTLARWRDELQRDGATQERLQARYVDTPDGRLARARLALRLRAEDGRWVQTLKGEGDSAIHRLEHEVAVAAKPRAMPAIDPARHRGHPAGEALARVLAGLPADALGERYRTDVVRLRRVLHAPGHAEVEAALDVGLVAAGEREERIAELELEHKSGPVDGLFRLAEAEVARGGLWLATVSKAERGERLHRGDAAPVAVKATVLELPAGAQGPQLLRGVLLNVLAQVLPNAAAVADGSDDADTIHQLRVGLRRLRTALRELAPLADAVQPAWEAPLARTFALLGRRRDDEAVAATVRPLLQAAGAPKTQWTAPAAVDTTAAVRDPAFQGVLVALLGLAHAPLSSLPRLPHPAVKDLVAGRLDRLHRQVARDARRFAALPVVRQHRVRKRLKRLRYLAEFARPLWPAKAVDRYVERLKPAQEALGTHHDVVVAAERFAHDMGSDPAAGYAAGFLRAHRAVSGRAAHRALKDVRKPFWRDG